MPDTQTKPTLLETLRERHKSLLANVDELIDEREAARAEFEALEEVSEDEQKAFDDAELDFRAATERLDDEIKAMESRVAAQQEKEDRRAKAEEVEVRSGEVAVIAEPLVYNPENQHECSYWQDLVLTDQKCREASIRDTKAGLERLHRHARQMEEIIPKEEEQRKRKAEVQIEDSEREFRRSFAGKTIERELVSPFERRVSPNRLPGQGGEFVPPKWEVDQYSPLLRAGRVIAPLANNMPLPPGTDVVKVPRVKAGSEVAPQLADNAGLASKDIESETIEAPIKTIGGIEDVALQVIEMSPGQIFGRIVMEDLTADWNRKVDREVSFGAGTSYTTLNAGTIKGLFPASNWGGEAHESGSAISGQVIVQGLGCNRAFIAQKRFNTENVVHVLHPKRAEYLMNTYDITSETGRRLFEPAAFPQFNVAGQMVDPVPAEGLVTRTPHGSYIYQSANITSCNKAATKTEASAYDYGLTFKRDDVWFFESDARMSVFSEVLSGTLTVRYRLYSYVGMLVRFEPSVQVCGGKPFEKEPTLGGYVYGA